MTAPTGQRPRPARLGQLADRLPAGSVVRLIGDPSTEIAGITHDSRAVAPGDLFACIEGAAADGHDHAPAAVAAGARSLIVGRPLDLEVAQIQVVDPRAALGWAASAFHGDPSFDLTVIGITGTNGKTTTAHLVGAILDHVGRRSQVLGTLSGVRTTPEASELQQCLARCRDEGYDSVVMEVSSHALALERVTGTRFRVAVFTNLGRDHLDLHGSQEEYFRAKARLFRPELSSEAVVNVDDPHGLLLADTAQIPTHPFSLDDVSEVEVAAGHHRFVWRGHRVECPLGGSTNVANSLAALSVAEVLGISPADAVDGLASASPVPGRFEVVTGDDGSTVVVDYAHTPEGLEALLGSVREVAGPGRVILVFGCGGDRDREKRPLMGAVGAELADVVFVTSDNPRREEPSDIAADIVGGMSAQKSANVRVELDRERAIEAAVAVAHPDDIVVIAGKGHETTQSIGGVEHPFDDRLAARRALDQKARP